MKFFFCSAIALAVAASAEDDPESLCIPPNTEKGPYYFGNFAAAAPNISCLSVTSNYSSVISWNVHFSLPGVVDDTYWSESYVTRRIPSVKMDFLNSVPVEFNYPSFLNKGLSAIAHITMFLRANTFDRGFSVIVKLCHSGPDPDWLGSYQREVQVNNVPYSLYEGYIYNRMFRTFVPKSCTTAFKGDMKDFLKLLDLESSVILVAVNAGFMIRSGVDAVLSVDKHFMNYTAAVDPSPRMFR